MKNKLIPLTALLTAAGIIFCGSAAAVPLPKRCLSADAESACQSSHHAPGAGALQVITFHPYSDVTQQGNR